MSDKRDNPSQEPTNRMVVFSGSSNTPLAESICKSIRIPLGRAKVGAFSDGEIAIEIHENIRGANVYIIQSTCPPSNHNLIELLLMIDAIKRASAVTITVVIPYYGYSRQDRKVAARQPISAKLVADLLTTAGADRIVSVDLHSGQIQGFFNIPVDNLYAEPVMVTHLQETHAGDEMVIVSPDAGGVQRARAFAKRLGVGLAIIDKRRASANVSEVMHVIGDVEGKVAVLVDDMIDTAGTITNAATALKERGATTVEALCTHAVLSGPAIERLANSPIERTIISDTIPTSAETRKQARLEVVSLANLLGQAIYRINEGTSVSSLFN